MSNKSFNKLEYYEEQLNDLEKQKIDILKKIVSLKGYLKSINNKIQKMEIKYGEEYEKDLKTRLNNPVVEF